MHAKQCQQRFLLLALLAMRCPVLTRSCARCSEGKVCVFTRYDRPDLFHTVALIDRANRAYKAGAIACVRHSLQS
eukprot:1300364-Rhodomonas_salina.2